ncbi:MAG: hypothetical protein HQ581_09290 [Planctomycetes bacterium]|nr:hypothetical protein [Planctomycetota bacterium]
MTFRRMSFHRECFLLTAVIALAGVTPVFAQKAPVPDAAAQAEALKIIAEIFEQQWAGAKTSAQKTALAEKMLEQATQTANDPTGRFVLLRVARDVATGAGDVTTAFAAIEMLDRGFAVDAVKMKTEALLTGTKSIVRAEHAKVAAEESIALVRAAIAQDDYPTAEQLLRVGQSAARKSRDGALIRSFTDLSRDMARIVKAYEAIQPALKVLDEKPTDPAANLTVGKFYCLVKGDWATGVPLLALADNSLYQAPARKELGEVSSPEEQVALGDTWWDLAQAAEEAERESLTQRAGVWYRTALPKLTPGLAKARTEKRVAEISEVDRPATSSGRRWQFQGVFNSGHGQLIGHPQVPAELEALYRNGRGRFWGVCRHSAKTIDGGKRGWFGKSVVWSVPDPSMLNAHFVLNSKFLTRTTSNGPTVYVSILNDKNELLGRLLVPVMKPNLALTLKYNAAENTVRLECPEGKDFFPEYSAPITIPLPANAPIAVALSVSVRYPGEKCDSTFALTTAGP